MKKYLIVSAVMLGLVVAKARAGFEWPVAENDVPQGAATADYAGTMISTSNFNLNLTTVTCISYPCRGVVHGVIFSSGSTVDFVSVFDATSPVNALSPGNEIARLYNINGSSQGVTIPGTAAGFSGPTRPIRFVKGLFWRASSAAYNVLTLQFYSEGTK